ncbi:MAG: pseudouridine synthase [Akkermansiaceae bacterium]|jgi:16S rRNA pseudouridine516 synthase|nr:pseudouridine synthase [Akkermansiaceae bacterium]
MRLDRFVGKWAGTGKRRTREIFEAGRVRLNGDVPDEPGTEVGKFDRVEVDDEILQALTPRYVMMHKPLGIVSATVDEEHQTVIDLIKEDWAGELHLAGRLDRHTSGLVVLTNNSVFSESLTEPSEKVGKVYLVEVDGPITEEVISAFEEGMWFAKEQVTTAPAQVELLADSECRLTIYEGKHHQVKRMFSRFGLKVTRLHREAIGKLQLPGDLMPGEWMKFLP